MELSKRDNKSSHVTRTKQESFCYHHRLRAQMCWFRNQNVSVHNDWIDSVKLKAENDVTMIYVIIDDWFL